MIKTPEKQKIFKRVPLLHKDIKQKIELFLPDKKLLAFYYTLYTFCVYLFA